MAWTYANQAAVESIIGVSNLRIISNVDDDDSTLDSTRLTASGEWADAYINARMSSLGFVTPLANMDATTTALVTEAAARLTAWKLNQGRIMASVVGKTPTEITKVLDEQYRLAHEFFREVAYRKINIVADRTYSRASKAEAYIPDVTSACWPGICSTWP